jgi:PAP2 superfamily
MRLGALVISLALAAAIAGCGEDQPENARAAESGSGSWKTWVLSSPDQVKVPEPPAGTQAAEEPAPGGAPAVEPWLQQTMTLVSRRPKDPVTASRNYAYVAVAMYDAAVAAGHWQDEHGVAGYPSVDAAIAGAGSRVIAALYPEHPAARLDADAEAGRGSAGERAGLELGRAVAERVIAIARADGSDREWDGRRPDFHGAWAPPPGSTAEPVAPLGGTWRTWVLESGSEVRAAPPPDYDSAEFREEAQSVLDTDRKLTDEQKRIARFWAGGDGTELPPGRWLKVTLGYLRERPPMSEVRTARAFALLAIGMADAGVAAWDTKYEYWVTRPINAIRDLGLDRKWESYLDTPFFPAYVSGHATYSGAAAQVLAYLFPEDADLWQRRAQEAADSRVYGGIHYPMDGEVGLRMGREIGRRVVARAQADGAGS